MSSSPGGNPRFSLFLRAIGVKPGFRRTGPSSLINIGFAALLGVVSGHYIFNEPLKQYWLEQQQLQQQQESSGEKNAVVSSMQESPSPTPPSQPSF
jgi:hypothetical protein